MKGVIPRCREMTSPTRPMASGAGHLHRQSSAGGRAMDNAIRFHQTGGPEVLRWEEVRVGEPVKGEARVRHVAVGLNFADTYFRTGLYPAALPNGIGMEGAGVVEAVGADVTHVQAGDRL